MGVENDDYGDEEIITSLTPLLRHNQGFNRLRAESFVRGDQHIYQGKKKIGILAVCLVAYFNVCGGPIGSEEIISSVGPLPGLIGCLIFAMLWGLPLSLITSELSTAFPDDGGYSIWVAEAFGEFWGFQESYWSWVSGVVDSAIYPVLAYETGRQLLMGSYDGEDASSTNEETSFWVAYSIKLVLVFMFSLPNLFCLNTFGSGLSFLAIFVVLPFIVLSIVTMFRNEVDFANLLEVKNDASFGDGWVNLISVLYWNFSGFDSVSTCAGEVKNPQYTYPRAAILSVLMVFSTYFILLGSVTVINKPNWSDWEEGSFARIADVQVGSWMAIWITIASFVSNIGMFCAEIFEDSWQLFGMAESGLVPRKFAYRHDRFGTPWMAILFSCFIIGILVASNFQVILCITNFFSVIAALLELFAFLKLRVWYPELPRPYKVPITSVTGIVLFLMAPIAIGIFLACSTLFDSWYSVITCAVAIFGGWIIYVVMKSAGHIDYQHSRNRESIR